MVGLGRLLAEGDASALDELRAHADDSRWRVREAVAMALQHLGADDFQGLATAMAGWARGSCSTPCGGRRALRAVLLTDPPRVQAVLGVLKQATDGVPSAGPDQRRSDEFKALRKGLGYCWSVAVAAAPEVGRPAFRLWWRRRRTSGDRDLRWIARENLRKRRLERLDADWVATLLAQLADLRC